MTRIPFFFLTYNVEFPDSKIKQYLDNVVAEKMHAQADDDRYSIQILDTKVDFRKDSNTIDKVEMRLRTKNGQKCLRFVTSSWSLLIMWKNEEE